MTSILYDISARDAETVLRDPEIYSCISEDGMDEWTMPENCIYLCGYLDEVIGCFILDKRSTYCADVHVQVLPQYRKQYSQQFGRGVLEWTWNNTELRKLVAEIPTLYQNVLTFAISMGFKVEGVNRQSFLKGGDLHDQWYVGLIK